MKLKSAVLKTGILVATVLASVLFTPVSFAESAVKQVADKAWEELSHLMGKENNKDVHRISLFFIQKAGQIKIMPDSDKNRPNCYRITLEDRGQNILYFSDAPTRVAGTVPVSKFLTSWQHGFSSPNAGPNAVIHGVNRKDKDAVDIVMLSHPLYDAPHRQMSYTACSIQHPHKIFKNGEVLKSALILIDPIHPWPP
jgi:hypothetical protein